MIKVGKFQPGSPVFIQKCRKCGTEHKSDHNLFICQQPNCRGYMTACLEDYEAA